MSLFTFYINIMHVCGRADLIASLLRDITRFGRLIDSENTVGHKGWEITCLQNLLLFCELSQRFET